MFLPSIVYINPDFPFSSVQESKILIVEGLWVLFTIVFVFRFREKLDMEWIVLNLAVVNFVKL